VNICLVSRNYPWQKPFDGMGTYTATMARALTGIGNRVSVLTRSPTGKHREVEDGGVKVIGIKHNPPAFLPEKIGKFSGIEYPRWSCAVADELRNLRSADFDIIEGPNAIGELLATLSLRKRPPVVVKIHGMGILGLKMRNAYRWYHYPIYRRDKLSLKRADFVTAVSEVVRRQCEDTYKISLSHAVVVHNAVDTEAFTPRIKPQSGSETVVLFAGRLNRQKGFDLMPEIVNRVLSVATQTRFVFAGEEQLVSLDIGEKSKEYLYSRISRDFWDKVDFKGAVSYEEMPEMYRQSDILLAPYRSEAFSGVCLEAGACALPVIGAMGTGMDYIIEHGETGFLEDVNCPEFLAEKLIALIKDRELARRMGEAARSRIEKFFNMETAARNTLEVYKKALQNFKG